MAFPTVNHAALQKARSTWKQAIQEYGRPVDLESADGLFTRSGVRAFCKRPKAMGQFDRTEQSFDQERYVVLFDADDFLPTDADPNLGIRPDKFARIAWAGERHAFLSCTELEMMGIVFGYRVLVKG